MSALSKAQQRIMGMAYAYKKGERPHASQAVKELADSMTLEQLRDFAATSTAELPKKASVDNDRNAAVRAVLASLGGAAAGGTIGSGLGWVIDAVDADHEADNDLEYWAPAMGGAAGTVLGAGAANLLSRILDGSESFSDADGRFIRSAIGGGLGSLIGSIAAGKLVGRSGVLNAQGVSSRLDDDPALAAMFEKADEQQQHDIVASIIFADDLERDGQKVVFTSKPGLVAYERSGAKGNKMTKESSNAATREAVAAEIMVKLATAPMAIVSPVVGGMTGAAAAAILANKIHNRQTSGIRSLAGPAGALAGGLLGSWAADSVPGNPSINSGLGALIGATAGGVGANALALQFQDGGLPTGGVADRIKAKKESGEELTAEEKELAPVVAELEKIHHRMLNGSDKQRHDAAARLLRLIEANS